ncbi:AAA domain-containing protein [Mycena indigotica]|uniref:AAA domain-containing protein n=1 Tax=Mycena indigotica TaxID=2126181 RepID=A0A8H6SAP1_9AGAR|nr:AAA domain-containing protein [Mycena indigotica]KAF7295433.1 AAA domain-containing protein [Mycena indigotica]
MATTFAPTGLLGIKTSFAPTGLLGGVDASESDAGPSSVAVPPEPRLGAIATPPSFVSNGLLGSVVETNSAKDADLPPSFVSNGLLGSIVEPPGINNAELPSFVSNGLLGSSSSSNQDLPETINSQPNTELPPAVPAYKYVIRATTFDGKTVFFRKKPKAARHIRNTTSRPEQLEMGNLLDVPIHRMLDELSLETATKLQASFEPTASTSSNDLPEDTLWVDRYRPRQFADLTGNERVAREVMTWVKQWDYCVFGKNKGKKRAREDEEEIAYDVNDEYRRPREKLLLLSGPPGLGKTSLAHVVARQAGYQVMEINASDARSGSVIDDRIRPALESGRAIGSTKPVLLVIDEIDGATGSGDNSSTFIHKLIQLTQDRAWKKSRSKKKDPNGKRPILRPIICICNDQNAAALTKLRAASLQVRFARPADIHTVKRLREVCAVEGLKADNRALTTLVGIARGDLRGCLNTLQFIKSRNEDVTEAVIRRATVGMKEAESSLISVLNSLFTPLTRKRVLELAMTEAEEKRYVTRLSREIEACGRDSSIAVGCFAHYATLHQYDANLLRFEKAMGWLETFDLLSAAMYSDGDFALSPYVSYTLVPFYPLFKERNARVERSQVDWESQVRTKANEEIYKTLARGLRTASTRHGGDYRHLCTAPVLQLEFAPYLNRIISPPLRPVNSQVIRPEERALLARLVNIMATLELQFYQERAEDGTLSYRLDPPIDVFVTYDGKRASDIPVSRYAVRHLVAGEIEAQLIARRVDIIEREKRGKHDSFFGGNAKSSPIKGDGQEHDPPSSPTKALATPPNKRARVDAPVVDIADRPPTDFFGRLITVPTSRTAQHKKSGDTKFRVAFKYNEGNSAAVRRPVKVSSFL